MRRCKSRKSCWILWKSRLFLEFTCSGKTKEFNQIIHRPDTSLPQSELKMKVMKDANGNKYEVKRISHLTFTVPQVFVFKDTFFFHLERRQNKLNFLNKWNSVYLQLTSQQIRLYQNLSDIEQEKTIHRINLHSLMVCLCAAVFCRWSVPS